MKTKDSNSLDGAAQTSAKAEKADAKKRKRWQLLGVGLLVVLSAGLVGIHFTKFSLVKAVVGGIPADRMIDEQYLKQQVAERADKYKLEIQYPDGTSKSFPLAETGIEVDVDGSIQQAGQIRKSGPLWQRLRFWRTQNIPLFLRTEEAPLVSFINSRATQASKPYQNAMLAIEQGLVKITSEAPGEGYGIPSAKETILSAVGELRHEPFQLKPTTLNPAITHGDLRASKQKVDAALAQDVTFTISGKLTKATAADIGAWIELTPVESTKAVDFSVNPGKVQEYMNAISKAFVSPKRTQVVSTQADGSTIVLVPGQSSAEIDNKEQIAADIAKKVAAGSGAQTNLTIKQEAFKTINAQAYDKWLAIDVTGKRMVAYEKTNLARTFLVSAGAPGTPTTLGVHKIYSKIRKQDMRGPNTDGTRYFQANVEWVNYFLGGEAIHGNYWRPAHYFGNINSSHGCVGITNSDAEWVYNWAPLGTPVIVYN